jgi:phage terminase Nu1 subunit (DNA packaging protein)
MPKKADRIAPLPAGLVPLLSQPQLETYYGVSDWTVLKWIKQGMPVRPYAGGGRRFDLAEVEAWHAANDPEVADAEGEPQLAAVGA